MNNSKKNPACPIALLSFLRNVDVDVVIAAWQKDHQSETEERIQEYFDYIDARRW